MKKININARYITLAILLMLSSILSFFTSVSPVHAAIGSVSDFNTPDQTASIADIGFGPDGNVWYTSYGPLSTTRIGKLTESGDFTEYKNRTSGSRYPGAITSGPDGNVWYSEQTTSQTYRIVQMTTSGTVLGQYPISGTNTSIDLTTGSDGNLWFSNGSVGKITPSGVVTQYSPPYPVEKIEGITLGVDGNIWFISTSATNGSKTVGKVTPAGIFTSYPFPNQYSYPTAIATGADGNVWVTIPHSSSVVRVTPMGVMTRYYTPQSVSKPVDITAGEDGNLWYVANGSGKIGRLTTAGVFTEYEVPGLPLQSIKKLVRGSNGALWLLDGAHRKISKIMTMLSDQTIAFSTIPPQEAIVDGPNYLPDASATSGLPVTITVEPSSSDVCVINGGQVVFLSAGLCVISANQPGDEDYKPAAQVQQSINVNPSIADVSVSLSCPDDTTIGSSITCAIDIENSGPAVAKAVNVTVHLPIAFSDIAVSSSDAEISGQIVNIPISSLASGDSVSINLSATVAATGKSYISVAVLHANPDPIMSNNITNISIPITSL